MATNNELHIYEEGTNLFWGLIIVFTTAAATYILADTFLSSGWKFSGFKQLLVLFLFAISFIGILKISDALLHFVFTVPNGTLHIAVLKGEQSIETIKIPLKQIETLKFSPHSPRDEDEAKFDFTTNYHLMWKKISEPYFRKLLDLDSFSFTLKVEDIAKIIRYIRKHQPPVKVPEEQADYFGL